MQFHDLIIDVILEIFRHYISDTMDGPFLLTLVCKFWQGLVLSTPRLWSYITIDESSPDYQAKLSVYLYLSQQVPVTVALVLPLSSLKPFKDPILRAPSLHIHLDNIVDADPRFETLREGDEAMEMITTLFKEAEVRYEGPITWYYSGAPIYLSTARVYSEVYSRQQQDLEEDSNEYFRSSYPIFHTLFSTRDTQIYNVTTVFRHLETMINLQELYLSLESLAGNYRTVLATITFPRLKRLLLDDSTSVEEAGTSFEELIPWISAPVLEYLAITAPVCSIVRIVHGIYTRNRPSSLVLKIRPQVEPYDWEPVCDGLSYLRTIDIETLSGDEIDGKVMTRLGKDILRHISPNAKCTMVVSGMFRLPLHAFRGVRCSINIICKGLCPPESFQIPKGNTVDTLTFRTPGVPPRKVQMRCRKLCYTPNLIWNNMHHPDSWPTDLEELDSGRSSFQDVSLRSASSTFSHLTTVTCTPQVASVLINRGIPTILQALTLVSTREIVLDEEGFHAVVNAFQKRLADDYTFGLNLAQLNVQYFPPWFDCLNLLHLIVQRRGQAILSAELPGFPHQSILSSIVSVLSGTPPVTDEAVYRQLVPKAYRSSSSTLPPTCHNCYNSGFECYPLPNQETCKRFIKGREGSITKYTIPI